MMQKSASIPIITDHWQLATENWGLITDNWELTTGSHQSPLTNLGHHALY